MAAGSPTKRPLVIDVGRHLAKVPASQEAFWVYVVAFGVVAFFLAFYYGIGMLVASLSLATPVAQQMLFAAILSADMGCFLVMIFAPKKKSLSRRKFEAKEQKKAIKLH